MNIDNIIAAINNPVRRQILEWLKDRSNFPPAIPEHADLDGVCWMVCVLVTFKKKHVYLSRQSPITWGC